MKVFFKQNGIFLLIYLLVLAVLGYILLHHGKVQIHKVINASVGNPYLDVFFKYITGLGDGLFAFLVILVFLFINIRQAVYILLSYLGAALVSSYLKYVVYRDVFRPHATFEYFVREKLNVVQGVEMAGLRSFPSGHALSAFALFFCLIFITKNQGLKILFFLLAFLASYSRLYLSQHWLVDVYVGSVIGVFFSLFFYTVFYNRMPFQSLNTTLPILISQNKKKRV